MTQIQTNEAFHSRYCAVRSMRMALIFVAFCTLEVFLSWKTLGKSFSEYSIFEILRDIAVIGACVIFMLMYKCFWERFVIGLIIVRYVTGLVTGFAPHIIDPFSGLVRLGNLALWVLALIVSLSMLVQSAWNPPVESPVGDTMMAKRRFLILCAVIVAVSFLGALMYFVPLR